MTKNILLLAALGLALFCTLSAQAKVLVPGSLYMDTRTKEFLCDKTGHYIIDLSGPWTSYKGSIFVLFSIRGEGRGPNTYITELENIDSTRN
jgi:hypothetical protein